MSGLQYYTFFYIIAINRLSTNLGQESNELTPYENQHGSRLNHEAIKDCHEHGNEPYEIYHAHTSDSKISQFVKTKHFIKVIKATNPEIVVRGHYAIISDPMRTISVLEPSQKYGCNLNLRETVLETSKQKNCEIAINAGYFDTKHGYCLGNVISDGYLAHDSRGIQNAHFGLTKDNKIFIGYVPEADVKMNSNFLQLVGGVMWVVRNGSGFVNTSKYFECEKTEETGTMDTFVNVLSSRTVIGHDSSGRVIIMQVDGKTNYYGISLWAMEELVKEMGFLNAINLDGGGSSTFVINGTVVNYPSDQCLDDASFNCERKVSTVICVHPPACEPHNCHGHGKCVNNFCICDKFWLPPHCDTLKCPDNCRHQGICTEHGCQCYLGFYGEDCSYSKNCTYEVMESSSLTDLDVKRFLPYVITAAISVVIFIVLLFIFYSCSCHCKTQQRFCKKQRPNRYLDLQALTPLSVLSDSEDEIMPPHILK